MNTSFPQISDGYIPAFELTGFRNITCRLTRRGNTIWLAYTARVTPDGTFDVCQTFNRAVADHVRALNDATRDVVKPFRFKTYGVRLTICLVQDKS